jgi:hypothetical protein
VRTSSPVADRDVRIGGPACSERSAPCVTTRCCPRRDARARTAAGLGAPTPPSVLERSSRCSPRSASPRSTSAASTTWWCATGRGGRALAPLLPRHLRGRPAEPGHPDPLRDPQRSPDDARRAGVRAVARPRGADARAGIPTFSLEHHLPLWAFDVFAVTLPHELGHTNLLNLLDLGGVPHRSADRDAPTRSSSSAAMPRSTPSRSHRSSTRR